MCGVPQVELGPFPATAVQSWGERARLTQAGPARPGGRHLPVSKGRILCVSSVCGLDLPRSALGERHCWCGPSPTRSRHPRFSPAVTLPCPLPGVGVSPCPACWPPAGPAEPAPRPGSLLGSVHHPGPGPGLPPSSHGLLGGLRPWLQPAHDLGLCSPPGLETVSLLSPAPTLGSVFTRFL